MNKGRWHCHRPFSFACKGGLFQAEQAGKEAALLWSFGGVGLRAGNGRSRRGLRCGGRRGNLRQWRANRCGAGGRFRHRCRGGHRLGRRRGGDRRGSRCLGGCGLGRSFCRGLWCCGLGCGGLGSCRLGRRGLRCRRLAGRGLGGSFCRSRLLGRWFWGRWFWGRRFGSRSLGCSGLGRRFCSRCLGRCSGFCCFYFTRGRFCGRSGRLRSRLGLGSGCSRLRRGGLGFRWCFGHVIPNP